MNSAKDYIPVSKNFPLGLTSIRKDFTGGRQYINHCHTF